VLLRSVEVFVVSFKKFCLQGWIEPTRRLFQREANPEHAMVANERNVASRSGLSLAPDEGVMRAVRGAFGVSSVAFQVLPNTGITERGGGGGGKNGILGGEIRGVVWFRGLGFLGGGGGGSVVSTKRGKRGGGGGGLENMESCTGSSMR